MKFHPLIFQASLAAGGIALMPFSYLQFAVPHDGGLVTLSHISWQSLTAAQTALYIPLVGIMLAFVVVHFLLTALYLKNLLLWVANKEEYVSFINDPYKNVGIFAVISSLAMSVNVFWGPVGFFVPLVSNNLQALMLPSLIIFAILWVSLLRLEFKVLKVWFTKSVDIGKFNFIWLLDVFAFGVVNLTGSGIAALSTHTGIATVATFGSLFTLSVGLFLLLAKLVYLIYLQIQSGKLPEVNVMPAFFLIVPITCLFGLSFFRITMYLQTIFAVELGALSFLIINFSYAIAIGWGLFALYLLSDYFRHDFAKSNFAPPQWGIV